MKRPRVASCLLVLVLQAGAVMATPTVPPGPPDYADPEQLLALVAGATVPYLLVDVRTPAEYNAGHIPTALNVPVTEIAQHPPTDDKDALIIVYCGSGVRSARAAAALEGIGYTRVVDFGPVSRWTGSLDSAGPGKEPVP